MLYLKKFFQTSGGVVNKKSRTNTRLRAILIVVIVAGKTFYLDCRCGHRKQADADYYKEVTGEKMRCRSGCLLVPEREGFIPVFSDASEISFLWGCDGT